jgi:flagellar basal-body rod modification protein FlgD
MQTNSLFNSNNNSASSSTSTTTGTIAGNTAAQTQEMFTKLLVAQIKNQDPLSPTDPSQFVNQLTQLSQTESLQNLSTLTSTNASVLQSMQVMALGAQVGSDLMVASDRVQLERSKVAISINQTDASSNTTLVLTGIDGVAHPISLGSQGAGAVAYTIDPVALGLPAGSYKIAASTNTKEVPTIGIQGRLNSVRLSAAGGVLLDVSHVGETSPGYITAFNGPSATQATQ